MAVKTHGSATERHRPRRARRLALATTLALVLALLGGQVGSVSAQAEGSGTSPLVPPDPQAWVDMEDLTWADYVPVRPEEWHDDSVHGTDEQFRGAVILADFTDQPFLVTQEQGSHPFGNPAPPGSPYADDWEPVPQDEVNAWFHEYYTTPNEFNGGQTIHSYWMETSHGRLGVTVDTFGPYTLPGNSWEYGLSGFGRNVSTSPTATSSVCPAISETCNRSLRNESRAAWEDEQGDDVRFDYDFIFYVSAGHDESSTWQEQGEMLFESPEDVPAAFGPPGAEDGPVYNHAGVEIPNYADTRYVDWTSWRAASNHWPNASGSGGVRSSTQAESSGQSTFAHEFSHILGLPDNYNNPFADNIRNYSGYWEMMSRGTFNGPGGTHNRWQVPNQGGSGLGPHHTVRHKRALDVYDDGELLELERDSLPEQGVATATLQARSSVPGSGGFLGVNLAFGEGGNQRTCQALGHTGSESFWCHGNNNYHNYTVEVVDRVGNDSFTPGHGVLIALSRNNNSQPNVWVIDPNPEDINMVDFYRPDGTPVMVVRGDPRQLNDATWHAGTGSGSDYEFVDDLNRLHMYVLDTRRSDDGVLLYDVAARHLDGAGDFERGVALGDVRRYTVGSSTALLRLPLANTGEGGDGVFGGDVFRLSAEVDGEGWSTWLPHEVKAADAGEAVEAAVYATRATDGAGSATVTITATSESDPSATASVTVELDASDVVVTLASASALLDALLADGAIAHVSDRNKLDAHLTVYFNAQGQNRARALDRFDAEAGGVTDPTARAALQSISDTLRDLL